MAAPINVKAEAGKPVWAPAGAFPEGFDWIQLTSGKLDVRYRGQEKELPDGDTLPELWRNSYFIDALVSSILPRIARQSLTA